MIEAKYVPQCDKCEKKFTTPYGLDKHKKRKIPCDRIIKCDRCNKAFRQIGDFKKHQHRKTPCEPIVGNMLVPIVENRCQFCGKEYKSKYSLKNHFGICKIKNGGMDELFNVLIKQKQEMEKQQEQIDKLKQQIGNTQTANGNQNINGNDNIINNHFNTTINIPLVCFGGDTERDKMLHIVRENLNILHRPMEVDIPPQEQLCGRIGEFVEAVYRNPEHKELQNVYTKHEFEKLNENNAFTYETRDTQTPSWHIGNWDKISKDILRKIYDCLTERYVKKEVRKKEDILNVMKTIFIASGNGDPDKLNITDENLQELYCEIGRRMGFSTLVLKD